MSKQITKIPAILKPHTSELIGENKRRRVAAYARVSTDHDDQFTSYEAQIDYYTKYIKSRDDWEFVKVYTDEGITGTSTKHREGFKSMVADALEGKIDLIVTKSVSRFARNTVDSLTTIRELKEKGVECYFEKENIWTFDGKGELLITIMSSLAQEESRSISENCTWGQRKRFADGKVTVPFKSFLGYDRGQDGSLIVNQKQAELVKRIYRMFMEGMTPYGIAAKLTEEKIPSPTGKEKWWAGTVKAILSNEKYKGDALLQKSFTVDFLTKKKKINEGEVPQYYVEQDHEAIIDPEIFDQVQDELKRRCPGRNRYSGVHVFSGKLKCGQCGSWYGSKVWHSNDKYRRVVWQCNHKYDGGEKCKTPVLTDDELKEKYIAAVNKLFADKDSILTDFEEILDGPLYDTSELETKRTEYEDEMNASAELVQKEIRKNALEAQDQESYKKRYDALTCRFNTAKKNLGEIEKEISRKELSRSSIRQFLNTLKNQKDLVTEFDAVQFQSLVDYITVYSKDDIRVMFKNGMEIKA
jgi:site-specific DNA recombinase